MYFWSSWDSLVSIMGTVAHCLRRSSAVGETGYEGDRNLECDSVWNATFITIKTTGSTGLCNVGLASSKLWAGFRSKIGVKGHVFFILLLRYFLIFHLNMLGQLKSYLNVHCPPQKKIQLWLCHVYKTLLCLFELPGLPDIATEVQPMVWVRGGAICCSSQWQMEGILIKVPQKL